MVKHVQIMNHGNTTSRSFGASHKTRRPHNSNVMF